MNLVYICRKRCYFIETLGESKTKKLKQVSWLIYLFGKIIAKKHSMELWDCCRCFCEMKFWLCFSLLFVVFAFNTFWLWIPWCSCMARIKFHFWLSKNFVFLFSYPMKACEHPSIWIMNKVHNHWKFWRASCNILL